MASETRTNAGRPVVADGMAMSTCGGADMPPAERNSAETGGMEHGSHVDVPAVAELAVNDVSDSEVAAAAVAAAILRHFGIPVFIVR